MLQLKKINKSYTTGDFTQAALEDVTISFREREFVAILGPSGSGKTTCLNIIGGLDRYDSGDLIINGKSTKEFKASQWDGYRNNSIGFIFQSYNLINHLSVADNVELAMSLSGVSREQKRKKALEVLEKVGLKDHIHKKPTQLSGGQMQRVAIARALVNDPDIILADEPTGALDSSTSKQIMKLIKELSLNKLVIMVTHNPELAQNYADRIVEFKDGRIIRDSNPLEEIEESSSYKLKKTSMSFFTALRLSYKNIGTKKWRTSLTAFASSIGIIGIALVLSLSNGFDKKIVDFENTTLSGFPIIISKKSADMNMESMLEQRNKALSSSRGKEKYPDSKVIYPYNPEENKIIHTNNISKEYVEYIEAMDKDLLAGVSYTRLVNMNILKSDGITASRINNAAINFSAYPSKTSSAYEGYLEKNYDLLAGSYPKEITDLVLVVDRYNRVDESVLEVMGLDYSQESIDFKDLVGCEFKLIPNDEFYEKKDSLFTIKGNPSNLMDMYNSEGAIALKISGILRGRRNKEIKALSAGIAYSDELSKHFIDLCKDSAIVKAQRESDYNVLTGEVFSDVVTSASSSGGFMEDYGATGGKDDMLAILGGVDTPYMITIYPRDFSTKERVLEYLNAWNDGLSIEAAIVYTDLAATITSLSGSIMDGITLVLIALAAISLVVSLIMIGIITYISVLERTKEIGVLRALGARKKDISRVFNAETFIVGSFSGALGILIAWLLTFPVNSLLFKLTGLKQVAELSLIHAILLVVVSIALTMIGGMIPAGMAARKDPVEALRKE